MQFVYPSFLWALTATLIPVIIHLFYLRRFKRVVFSDIRFLKEVQEVSKSRQKIRDLLILIARILAVSALVFAFAQPYIAHDNAKSIGGEKSVCIYIDNSPSMLIEGTEGSLFEAAKNKARAIVDAYGTDASFIISSNQILRNRWVGRSEALNQIDEIKIAPVQKNLEIIRKNFNETFYHKNTGFKEGYVISDFQSNAIGLSTFKPDTNLSWNLIANTPDAPSNIYVDSAWFTSPFLRLNRQAIMKARISNSGKEKRDGVVVTLTLNDIQKAIRNIDIEANSLVDLEFTFTPTGSEWQQGKISVEDYPVTFDDQLFFTFRAAKENRILSINGLSRNDYFGRLFSGDKDYRFVETSQQKIDYTALSDYDLIILNEPTPITSGLAAELKKYVEEGGQLMVLPSEEKDNEHTLNPFLMNLKSVRVNDPEISQVKVSRLNMTDPFFADVFTRFPQQPDLPSLEKYFPLNAGNNARGRMLMQMNNGRPFLWYNPFGKGRVVVCSVKLSPEYSNFQSHALFVPVMLKLAMGVARQMPSYYIMNRENQVSLGKAREPQKVVRFSNDKWTVTSEVNERNGIMTCNAGEQLVDAGVYAFRFEDHNTPDGFVAFNFNRTESEMFFDDLAKFESGNTRIKVSGADNHALQQQILSDLSGTPLWRWFLLAALICFATEIILLRAFRLFSK